MKRLNAESYEPLCRALLSLESVEECRNFLLDACTMQELEAIVQRFDVATRLYDGQNYALVKAQTGASSATISRVNKCIQYGTGAYSTVISRMRKQEE